MRQDHFGGALSTPLNRPSIGWLSKRRVSIIRLLYSVVRISVGSVERSRRIWGWRLSRVKETWSRKTVERIRHYWVLLSDQVTCLVHRDMDLKNNIYNHMILLIEQTAIDKERKSGREEFTKLHVYDVDYLEESFMVMT